MIERRPTRVLLLSLLSLTAASLSGCGPEDCCDWDCCYDDDPLTARLAEPMVASVMGELYPRQPLEHFRLIVVDGQLIDRGDLTDEQVKEMLESKNRQVILDSKIIQVSDGFSTEIGIDPLRNGFAIESEFGQGRTNTQIFSPKLFKSDEATFEWLRYSYRTGEWTPELQLIQEPRVITENEREARIEMEQVPTERRVPWLPPGTRLREAGDNKLILLVNPAILNDDGTVRRPPANVGEPRTQIMLPKLSDSKPRTDIIVPDGGTVLVGGLRRGNGDGMGRPRSRFQFDLTAGYTGVNLPTVGTGTLIDGANETYLVKSPEILHGYNIGGRFTLPLSSVWKRDESPSDGEPGSIRGLGQRRGRGPFLYIDGNYINASGDAHTIIEPGSLSTGVTSNTIDTPGMTTGIGFGATGADATLDIDFEQFELEIGGGWSSFLCGCHCTTLTLEPHANVAWTNTDVMSRISNITFMDNFADLNQKMDEYVLGAGFRAAVNHRFNNKLSAFGSVDVGGYYYNADGSSNQTFMFPVVGPPNDDFSIIQDDSKDGFGFTAGVEAGLTYRITHNISLTGLGGFKWDSDQVFWKNPQNPLDSASGLDSDDGYEVYARVQFSCRF